MESISGMEFEIVKAVYFLGQLPTTKVAGLKRLELTSLSLN